MTPKESTIQFHFWNNFFSPNMLDREYLLSPMLSAFSIFSSYAKFLPASYLPQAVPVFLCALPPARPWDCESPKGGLSVSLRASCFPAPSSSASLRVSKINLRAACWPVARKAALPWVLRSCVSLIPFAIARLPHFLPMFWTTPYSFLLSIWVIIRNRPQRNYAVFDGIEGSGMIGDWF